MIWRKQRPIFKPSSNPADTKRGGPSGNIATAAVFLLPLLLIIGVFLLFSIVFIVKNSFFELDLSFSDPVFVGWDNYRALLTDTLFYRSIVNNLVFAGTIVLSGVTLGFMLAVIVSLNVRFGKVIFAVLFIPAILPRALVATVFRQMLEYHTGSVNGFLQSVGISTEHLMWLTDPALAYVSVIGVFIYMIGIPLLYYNADLASIEPSVLESAVIDGAGMVAMIVRIIYPLVGSSHRTIIISSILAGFRMFEVVFLLTRSGPGFTTEVTGTYVFRFTRQGTHIGFVSAASAFVLVMALLLAIVQTIVIYRRQRQV